MSCPVISPALHVLQPLPIWENYMSCTGVSPALNVLQPLPIGKILCPTPVISSTLWCTNPAHWANYMSYLVISPTLFVLQSLPIGKILCPVSDFKYRETCPLGKFYVLPSDLSCTLRTSNAARWADSTS